MSRDLNPRQMRFITEYMKTGIAARSYVAAGYRVTSRKAMDAHSSRLVANGRVQAEISRRKRAMLKRSDITIEKLLNDLVEDRELARSSKQASAAISATQLMAKLVGLLIDRKESGAPGEFGHLTSPEQVREKLAADYGPEVAQLLDAALRAAQAPGEPIAQPVEPEPDAAFIELPTPGDTIN